MSIEDKIYWGGHMARWSLSDVLEGEDFKLICLAEAVEFERKGFHTELQKYSGPQARYEALKELLTHGSLGLADIEERDGVLHVTANWCFVG